MMIGSSFLEPADTGETTIRLVNTARPTLSACSR